MEFSDGSVFSFMPYYLPPELYAEDISENLTWLRKDHNLNDSEEAGLRFASECLRAEKNALRLIARAEQTSAGLSLKLEKRGHDRACIQKVLGYLNEIKLIDDRRFVRLWLASRLARRADSPRYLLRSLCSRGIDADDAKSGINAVLDLETECKLIKRYAEKLRKKKKYAEIIAKNKDNPERSKKFYLKNEGFSPQAIEIVCSE